MLSQSSVTRVHFLLCLSVSIEIFNYAEASNGDRSFVFGKCLKRCTERRCSNATQFWLAQPVHMKLLSWSCQDECRYQCMWDTVEAFQKDGSRVPQFYGKWPFVRFAGIQEPASMVFSLLNAVSHLAVFSYRSKVPPTAHMYRVWHGMAVVGVVTWLCAAVFHTRDTSLTEKMDYFSAFALVLYNVFTLLCRVIGTSHRATVAFIAMLLMAGYCYHIHYLAFIHFDYGYNMVVNVTIGTVNGVCWLLWCYYHWRTKPYVKKCLCVILGLNALLLLELGDFPPLLWTFDAHAIWHAGTVPLTLLWYSFITDDALDEDPRKTSGDVKKMI